MTRSLLVDRPAEGLRTLSEELATAERYLERDPLAPAHLAAARAILEAAAVELRASLAELERLSAATADPHDCRGFRTLIASLVQAQAELASPHGTPRRVARARMLVGCVSSLLGWAATNLEIKCLPEVPEPKR